MIIFGEHSLVMYLLFPWGGILILCCHRAVAIFKCLFCVLSSVNSQGKWLLGPIVSLLPPLACPVDEVPGAWGWCWSGAEQELCNSICAPGARLCTRYAFRSG